MNIVTVKTLAEVTPEVGYDYLLKLGFTTLVDSRTEDDGRVVSDINLPMALGGLTDGVTNLELTAAYSSIASGGIYNEPVFLYEDFRSRRKSITRQNSSQRAGHGRVHCMVINQCDGRCCKNRNW